MKKLVIQIPAFNEEDALPETIRDIPRTIPGIDEVVILVVDDGSKDNTREIALKNGADYVIRHPTNRGLARTFMTGIQTSLALGADIIVNTDADNQYPGKFISSLVAPIVENRAAITIGDRQVKDNEHFSLVKRALERLGSWFVRVISNTDVPYAPSGFRAYSRYVALHLQVYNKYSYTLETLILAGKENHTIAHLPIKTNSTRPSRLHKGILHFIWRQSETIMRSYILYQPLRSFSLMSVPFLSSSLVLIGRFLFYYFTDQSGIGRYAQSVSIGGTLGSFGLLLLAIGLIGDAIKTNRQSIEEILVHQRNIQKIDPDVDEFLGCRIYRR